MGRGVVVMQHLATDPDASRSSADVRAFREARWLLWVFGVSGLPATLMLATMGKIGRAHV